VNWPGISGSGHKDHSSNKRAHYSQATWRVSWSNAFDRVNISLDSSVEEKHDFGRGKGSFRKVVEGVPCAPAGWTSCDYRQAGPWPNTTLKALPTCPGLSGRSLVAFCTHQHCAFLFAPRTVPSIDLSRRSWRIILQALGAFSANFSRYYPMSRDAHQIGPHVSCGLGKRIVSVDSHGDVFPCQALHDPDWSAAIGTIRASRIFVTVQT